MVLVQSGAHDLSRRMLGHFLRYMETYVDVLSIVRRMTRVRRHNFIVVTTPHFPMAATAIRMDGDRNSFCVAASVRRLKQLLAKHEFEVFDEFSVLRPMAERHVCVGHYICPQFDGQRIGVYDDVGFTAVRLLVSHVCKDNTRWLRPTCQ